MTTDDVERATAEVDKLLELFARLVTSVDHVRHVGRQHERRPITAQQQNTSST